MENRENGFIFESGNFLKQSQCGVELAFPAGGESFDNGIPASFRVCPLSFLCAVFHEESESTSRSVVSDSLGPHGLYSPWNSPGQYTGVGSLSLLQGIFQTQGSNPGFLYCWRFLYQLSHKGSPTILEWVAYPLSSRCSRLRRLTRVSCIAGRFFTN